MRLPKDKQTRINLYFLSIFILPGLIFLGANVYKNVRYSHFDLDVSGKSELQYYPLFSKSKQIIANSVSNASYESFSNLEISWWGNRSPAYKLGKQFGLWFKVVPTLNGNIVLTNPAYGTPLDAAWFDIRTQAGKSVQKITPGQWYRVKQYGQWYTVKFQWDSQPW